MADGWDHIRTPLPTAHNTTHEDLHWTFCHQQTCNTHEKQKQEKHYFPPGENGYPYDHCYCGQEHHPDLDAVIRMQKLNPRKACRGWQRGKRVCHNCGYLVKIEGHDNQCSDPRLTLTSPCNYDHARQTTPINNHPIPLHNNQAKEPSPGDPVVLERVQREQPVAVPERVQRDHPEPTPTQTQSTTKPSNNPISPETPFPWRNNTQCRSRIHEHSGPRRVEKSSYRTYPPRSPRNNRASLVGASALRGGLISRINDDMLVGAIAASASLWITGITIAICYLMIRR
jgi:hypothetical protein